MDADGKAKLPVEFVQGGGTAYQVDYFDEDGVIIYSGIYIGEIGKILFEVYFGMAIATKYLKSWPAWLARAVGANVRLAATGTICCSLAKTAVETVSNLEESLA